MGKKVVLIIPTEYHEKLLKVMNQPLKISWEEIIEQDNEKGVNSKKWSLNANRNKAGVYMTNIKDIAEADIPTTKA